MIKNNSKTDLNTDLKNTKTDQGKRLSQLRKAKGLTAEKLAHLMTEAGAKVSRGAISNWERGTNGIVSSKLSTLANILDCQIGYLLHGEPDNPVNQSDTHYLASSLLEEPLQTSSRESTSQSIKQSIKQPIEAESLASTSLTTNTQNSQDINSNLIQDGDNMNSQKPLKPLKKSSKLANVCYDIRGPLLQTANKMEADGHRIIKLNVGNPAPFKLNAPQEILHDVAINLSKSTGYCDSQGIFSARKAVLQYYQSKGLISAVDIKDVYIGNGVSELIVMTMQAMLDDGDEVLIPMPDYPLWTAAANLAGGKAVHYRCDESRNWQPDIEDIKSKITERTKGIVVINPNNPTGALYSNGVLLQIVSLAKEHGLVIMADEIYDRVLYDNAVHTPMCTLTKDVLVLTYNGLSKSHRIAGFRSGWLLISGRQEHAGDFIEGLNMLASMRLCANVPSQYAIQTALGGYQSMQALTAEDGRLYKQREMAVERLNDIKGVSCTMPQGAFYCFPKIDLEIYPIADDMQFMMDLLIQEKVLIVQGTGFNWHKPDHFRVVFLPNLLELEDAMNRLERFFECKRIEFGTD